MVHQGRVKRGAGRIFNGTCRLCDFRQELTQTVPQVINHDRFADEIIHTGVAGTGAIFRESVGWKAR